MDKDNGVVRAWGWGRSRLEEAMQGKEGTYVILSTVKITKIIDLKKYKDLSKYTRKA